MKSRVGSRFWTLGLVAISGVLATGCPPGNIVVIPDEELEIAIRTQIRKPFGFITEADMQEMRRLDASLFDVRDLRGLENATNLLSLDLSKPQVLENAITDISPLSNLRNLTFLNLENNQITDITPVSGLFNLDQLLLAGNEVFNIGPLVANAESGGLGPGDTVTLTRRTLIDEDGETSEIISDQLNRLVDLGVDVVLIEEM